MLVVIDPLIPATRHTKQHNRALLIGSGSGRFRITIAPLPFNLHQRAVDALPDLLDPLWSQGNRIMQHQQRFNPYSKKNFLP
jgi:hypothetical protein